MLCKYKHIFGKERQGFHSVRLFDVAILDVLGTLLVAGILTLVLKKSWMFFGVTSVVLIIVGIILHRLFCVNTKLNTMIFGRV